MKSESEKKAQKKYLNKIRTTTKAQLNCTIDRADFDLISVYCKESNTSKAQLIVQACKAWIVDHPVDNNQEL